MADYSKLAFSSAFRYERIHTKSHKSFTTSGGSPNSVTVTIPHNLGYVPFYRIALKLDGISKYVAFSGSNLYIGDWLIESLNADTSSIKITIDSYSSGQQTGTVYYRIYEEEQA